MPSTFKEKILKEIENIPEHKMQHVYKLFHRLAKEFMPVSKKTGKRGSLKGIWKGTTVDESTFIEAKKSLFPYEHH